MHTLLILSLCNVQYGEFVAVYFGRNVPQQLYPFFYQQLLKSQKLGTCAPSTVCFPSGILGRPSAIIYQCKVVHAKW